MLLNSKDTGNRFYTVWSKSLFAPDDYNTFVRCTETFWSSCINVDECVHIPVLDTTFSFMATCFGPPTRPPSGGQLKKLLEKVNMHTEYSHDCFFLWGLMNFKDKWCLFVVMLVTICLRTTKTAYYTSKMCKIFNVSCVGIYRNSEECVRFCVEFCFVLSLVSFAYDKNRLIMKAKRLKFLRFLCWHLS
jgi:hypothetical protein